MMKGAWTIRGGSTKNQTKQRDIERLIVLFAYSNRRSKRRGGRLRNLVEA